jgi:hypothetical protein
MIQSVIKRLIVIIIAALFLVPIPASAQSSVQYRITQSVEVDANDQATVEYGVSVVNSLEADSFEFAVSGLEITNLAATVNGSQVDVSVAVAENNALFPHSIATISLPDSIGKSWKFSIQYQTNSLMQRTKDDGTNLIVSAPQRSAEVTKESLSIELPLGSTLPRAFGLEPNNSTVDGERQRYEYIFNGARNSAAVLLFGSSQTNSFKLESTLKNDGWWWQTKQVALPTDTALQKSFLQSVSPEPSNVRLDRYGNMFVEYRLAPRSSVTLEALVSVLSKSIQYDLRAAEGGIDTDEFEIYLDNSDRYSEGQIRSAESIVELTRSLLQQARDNDLSVVQLAASARASGLPAREVHGWIAPFMEAEPVAHQWVEVFVPNVGWVVLDPAMSKEFASFGRSGSWRIRGSIIINQSTADMFLPTDSQTLNWRQADNQDAVSFEASTPAIDVTNYVILPGISYRRTTVSIPSGVVRDNVATLDGDEITRLGSLAPLQSAVRSDLAVLGESFSSEQINVGEIVNEQFSELNTTTVSTNWLPLVVLVSSGAALFGFNWWNSRRRSGKSVVTLNQPDEIDIRSSEELLQSDIDERR